MLILGAKGFAKEVLEVMYQNNQIENVAFYDDVNSDIDGYLYGTFPVLKSSEEARKYFKTIDNRFTIGIGDPFLRKKLFHKFTNLGGKIFSTISPKTSIGNFGNKIGDGCNIMTGSVITNDVIIGLGTLINLNCTVGHDCIIGDFVEMCPGVHISGNCKIGMFTFIGTNATVLPKINIGKNVIVGAGSVVTKDIPDNSLAYGNPAKIIKALEPLNFL
jgi:sugar O-acyltransferase (sialic acid O-acetyltransferase NeuD family)